MVWIEDVVENGVWAETGNVGQTTDVVDDVETGDEI